MPRHDHQPARLSKIARIGVDRMGAIADAADRDFIRLENLDVNIPIDDAAIQRTIEAATRDSDNSYLPFVGQNRLRSVAAQHVSELAGVPYSEINCVISAGGLSGILNVLLATTEVGDEVIMTDPTYSGLINRVLLAGGIPRLVPFSFTPGEPWKLNRDALRDAITPSTKTMLLMSPSMPSGGMLDEDDWALVADLCIKNDLLLILDSAMERIVYNDKKVIHPAGSPGMAERTITVGSASKELRMIGWRIGWIVAPETYIPSLVAVSLANVVVPVGIGQDAAAVALERSVESMPHYIEELQRRRDLLVEELDGLPFGLPEGGWSMLLRVSDFGLDGEQMSERLLQQGVCATAMTGWGVVHGAEYIRFVYANESLERLMGLGERVRAALN